MLSGLGCDCSEWDTDGNCLDPAPCPGDSASFGSQTGIVYSEPQSVAGKGQVYTNANATVPTTTTTTSTVAPTTATATSTSSSCTSTLIPNVCDWMVYVGVGLIGLALLSENSGSGGRRR